MISATLIILAIAQIGKAQESSATVAPAASGSTSSYQFGPTTSAPLGNTPTEDSEYWPGYQPLNQKVFTYPDLPYKVDTQAFGRGPQSGYNLCNSTTAGEDSECQTVLMNSFTDFCLWGLREPGATVGDSEASAVAYCADAAARGTRQIPDNTITSMTWLRTKEYPVTGLLDQTQIDIAADDFGGEMDPVGADYRGNPLGGLMFSNAFSQNTTEQQIHHWNYFVGGGIFCYRFCLPDSYNATKNCEHIYDRIGCAYNAPGNYTEGNFEVCDGEVALPVGTYVGNNGATSTWTQPPESLGAITSVPYTPSIPPSSNCVTPTSLPAFFALPGRVVSSSGSSGAPAVTGSATTQVSPAQTGVTAAANNTSGANNIASISAISLIGALLCVLAAF